MVGDEPHPPYDRPPLSKQVLLGRVAADATGTRARPWPDPEEAALDGVFTLRTCDDAGCLAERLAAGPCRVLVIGGGFTGSEVASACRERGLEVTVTERGAAPLVGALGGTLSKLIRSASASAMTLSFSWAAPPRGDWRSRAAPPATA